MSFLMLLFTAHAASMLSLDYVPETMKFGSFTQLRGQLVEHVDFSDTLVFAETVSLQVLPFLSGHATFERDLNANANRWTLGAVGYISSGLRPMVEVLKDDDFTMYRAGVGFYGDKMLLSAKVLVTDEFDVADTLVLDGKLALMPVYAEDSHAVQVDFDFNWTKEDDDNMLVYGAIGASFKKLLASNMMLVPRVSHSFLGWSKIMGVDSDVEFFKPENLMVEVAFHAEF